MNRLSLLVAAFVALILPDAHAVPSQITVQGRLTDLSGDPLPAGSKTFTFRLFTAGAGGVQIWPDGGGEIQSITSGADGLWIGLLGAIDPLNDAVFADSVRWLEVDVNGTTLPRIRLVTGPYAYRVATVDGASGGNLTSKLSIGTGHTNSGLDGFAAGNGNEVSGDYGTVGGGQTNGARGEASVVGGGVNNWAIGDYSVVGGGHSNTSDSAHATIAGGIENSASDRYATVGGGSLNQGLGPYSAILGGANNVASGYNSTISGGRLNVASGSYSTVAGGSDITASSAYASVGGGDLNDATGLYSTVAGGARNVASGIGSTVGGGGTGQLTDSNIASGLCATVPGGWRNAARGNESFAAGGRAKAEHNYTFVWNSNFTDDFVSTGTQQFLIRAGGGVGIGTNSPTEQLHVAGHIRAGGSLPMGISTEVNALINLDANFRLNEDDVSRGGAFRIDTRGGANQLFNWLSRPAGSGTETLRMVLTEGGDLGIGSNSPDAALHVQDGSAGVVTANGNSSVVFERNAENWIQMLTPDGSQCGILFGIGPSAVAGSIRFNAGNSRGYDFHAGSNDSRLILDSLGNLTADGCIVGSNIACPSDVRLKRDIETLPDALEKVKMLRGVKYAWRTDEFPDREFPAGEQVGLIAQEVQKVVPQSVIDQSDGYLTVDYARLVPLLIESIKEQQEQIDELKSRLDRQTQ